MTVHTLRPAGRTVKGRSRDAGRFASIVLSRRNPRIRFVFFALAIVFGLAACASAPPSTATGTVLTMQGKPGKAATGERAAIEKELAKGTPSSFSRALVLIAAGKTLAPSDATLYRWYATELGRIVYPERLGTSPVVSEPPEGHPWIRAFADARTGRIGVPRDGADTLELLALASSVCRGESRETVRAATLALDQFDAAGMKSTLAQYLRGLIAERSGDYTGAQTRYAAALSAAPDCYPALFGNARILITLGRPKEAVDILLASRSAYETNLGWVRLLAIALYNSGRYDEAGPYVASVLRQDPLDSEMLLLRADMLVRAGDYRQAVPLLDAYGAVDSSNRRYLLLRGRTAWEGSRNRDEALKYLRKLLSIYPDDDEASLAAARILSGGSAAERDEAYTLAGKVLARNPKDSGALRVLLAEDVRRRNWTGAASTVDRLAAYDTEYRDRATMYMVYRSAGTIRRCLPGSFGLADRRSGVGGRPRRLHALYDRPQGLHGRPRPRDPSPCGERVLPVPLQSLLHAEPPSAQ
jgi:tetratricopeptide (TPR) repeat protein